MSSKKKIIQPLNDLQYEKLGDINLKAHTDIPKAIDFFIITTPF